jgi:NAD(P)-dependent dehydrogenase (short-subunit alcohol dehydrogenase family)
MIDLGLTGKRILVAGAGYLPNRAGLGQRTSRALSDAGAQVVCLDKDPGRADAAAKDLIDRGGNAAPIVGDITSPEAADEAVRQAIEVWGGLDGCVDIIGGARWGVLMDTTDAQWDWVRDNNINQVFYLYRAVSRHLVTSTTGTFMTAIASVDGTMSSSFHAAYGAAKAGVISLTKTYAEELGPYGVRVNAVAPGSVGFGNEDLPEHEYGTDSVCPLAAPRSRDIANAVLFLASSLAGRITGQTIIVDGGASIVSPWGTTAEDSRQRHGPDE